MFAPLRQCFKTPAIRRAIVLRPSLSLRSTPFLNNTTRFTGIRNYSSHDEETFEEFTTRYVISI